MPYKIVRNDITKMNTEAIVNTANREVTVGTGCDSAVYAAAEAEKFGIKKDRAVNYECDAMGTAFNFDVLSDTVSCLRKAECKADFACAVKECLKPIKEDYNKRHRKGKTN